MPSLSSPLSIPESTKTCGLKPADISMLQLADRKTLPPPLCKGANVKKKLTYRPGTALGAAAAAFIALGNAIPLGCACIGRVYCKRARIRLQSPYFFAYRTHIELVWPLKVGAKVLRHRREAEKQARAAFFCLFIGRFAASHLYGSIGFCVAARPEYIWFVAGMKPCDAAAAMPLAVA